MTQPFPALFQLLLGLKTYFEKSIKIAETDCFGNFYTFDLYNLRC